MLFAQEVVYDLYGVEQRYDEGEIVAQTSLPVLADDTAETLAARVLACEHRFLVETVSCILHGEIPCGDVF